jgi:catechol 2,3-dioxygenase-like lactoylglutathione lyase family enzyme
MDGEQRTGVRQASHEGVSPIKVKKLGHFVYEVADVARSVKFWTELLGFRVTESNEVGITFLRYGADHHGIGLFPRTEKEAAARPHKYQHLAFEVETVEALIAARDYLRANGVPILAEGRKGAGSNTGVNFLDPDGNQFELYCDMDQIGESGRIRPSSQWVRADTLEEAIAKPVAKTW